jgi:Zn-dependent M28 family amino/carboxypeptidase
MSHLLPYVPVLALMLFAAPATASDSPDRSQLDPAAFARHVETLASDAFEGRAPGTRGETLTIDYIRNQFEAAGLVPGNDGEWLQVVPTVETLTDTDTALELRFDGRSERLANGEDMTVGAASGETSVQLEASELVFVGYGIHAPEAGWNDYTVDVRGKTVVMLVNDPGYATGDPTLFDGRRMTWYGRWTYKFDEAARQGAAAAFIIHDDGGAGYGWNVVRSGWYARPQFELPTDVDPRPLLAVRGWWSADAARRSFDAAGLDLDALRLAAAQPGFVPVALPGTASIALQSSVRRTESHNVLAMLPGRDAADEAVLYTAHWDHFGVNPSLEGDQIINGAVDNATGVAAILEIARAFAARPERPRRSLLFAAVTLEESGLFGSRFLARQPPLPPANMVAVLNIDALDPALQRDRMPRVGLGSTELDGLLAPIAEALGMPLIDEPQPEKGLNFRSDHFSFAQVGVPALVAGLVWSDDYTARHYHQPSDRYDPDWDLSGVMREVEALYRLGAVLADGDAWPNWQPTSPFRAIRDRDRGAATRPPAAD